MDLIVRYDPEADVLVLKVREGALANEELLDNDVVLGYDSEGKMVSVEVLDVQRKGCSMRFWSLQGLGERRWNTCFPN